MSLRREQPGAFCSAFVATLALVLTLPTKARGEVEPSSETSSPDPLSSEPDDSDERPKLPPIFFLRDGSKVAGFPALESLRVETRYGTLTVPVEDLLRLNLSRRVDPTVRSEVSELIAQLGSEDFDARESAMDRLREIGPDALPALREARGSDNEERKNRVEVLVGELDSRAQEQAKARHDEFEPTTGTHDVVETRRFTIRGRVAASAFSVQSRYGSLELSAGDVLGIDFRAGGIIEGSVSVNSNHLVPKSWLNTKIVVSNGQKLEIRASGSLRVQNYNLNVGPAGTTRYSGNTYKTYPQLALIGRVGKNGREFVIGERFEGRVRGAGPLYVGIVPFRRNYSATGSFRVSIQAGE